jgi:uncharacterized protein (UPF0335 family)
MSEVGGIGHNSVAGEQLRLGIEKIERFEEAKKEIAEEIKDELAMLKGQGFNTKIVRKIIRMRKQDQAAREEEEAITELYLHALGMI